MQSVATLFGSTVIAPNHAAPETSPAADGTFIVRVGELRRSLAAFSMTEAEFVTFVTDELPPQPDEYERIIATNLGRLSAVDSEAFELELGPNNRAAGQSVVSRRRRRRLSRHRCRAPRA